MEIGAGVTGFQIGQRAVVQPIIADDTCAACKRGLENVCYSGGFVGLSGWGGGLSGAVSVPSKLVIPLPDHVPLEIGALVEPLAIGWHAVRQSPLTPTSTILILGGGPVGIAIINVLKSTWLRTNNRFRTYNVRQNFAKKFGADVVLDPIGEGEDVIERRVD
ncbi:hypothetical protein EYC84_011801 [Monilinia fructicola]|uniref:Alcohol dehydrogenase-like N-terminal domain-containing protein n=1 Tax=Monilinia fructicola TaxID=38448 RepID=A0A5M9J947_MONFR|nr:hypothetical protein EYC84_011801 [Monilinia fructicola]